MLMHELDKTVKVPKRVFQTPGIASRDPHPTGDLVDDFNR
jgi:hypothetical protein